MKFLPLKTAKSMSSIIFRKVGKLSSAHKTAIKNCRYIFPNHKEKMISSIIDKSWENIGETICELLRFQEVFNKKNSKIQENFCDLAKKSLIKRVF